MKRPPKVLKKGMGRDVGDAADAVAVRFPYPDQLLRPDGRTATDNERRALSLLRQNPGQSRAELGRIMDIATFSAGRIVDGLLERGLLAESDPIVKGRGHPSPALSLRPDAVHSVGVSVMTDAIHMVLVDFSGGVVAERELRLEMSKPTAVAEHIRAAIDTMLAAQGLDRTTLAGAGLGVTGYFVGPGDRVNPPAPLDDWALVELTPLMSEILGCGVWLDNDGNVAALGEALFGAGRLYASFAYLFFAAGFGGGVVIDGALVRGHHGNSGEFGACVPPGFPIPNLERLRASIAASQDRPIGLAEALDLADPAAPDVSEWLTEAAGSLNLVISSIAGVLDPEAIVLGGRLPSALSEALIARLAFHNPERRGYRRPMPRLMASHLAGDATAIGAATLPLKAAFF